MWCVLCTTIDLPQVIDELLPNDYSNIVSHLNSSNVDLRLATGEALAFVSSLVSSYCEENGDTYSPYYFNSYIDVQQVKECLSGDGMSGSDYLISPRRSGVLSASSVALKKGSKKERLIQKQGFSKYLQSFEHGKTGPAHPVSITVRTHQFQFHSWSEIKELEMFRDILQEGFQTHLQGNSLLADVFGIEISTPMNKMTKLEKRQYMSTNSVFAKGRTRKRAAGRDAKRRMQDNPGDHY